MRLVPALLTALLARLPTAADAPRSRGRALDGDGGFSTAELLGNAALGIAALVVIWGALQALGLDVVAWVRTQLLAP